MIQKPEGFKKKSNRGETPHSSAIYALRGTRVTLRRGYSVDSSVPWWTLNLSECDQINSSAGSGTHQFQVETSVLCVWGSVIGPQHLSSESLRIQQPARPGSGSRRAQSRTFALNRNHCCWSNCLFWETTMERDTRKNKTGFTRRARHRQLCFCAQSEEGNSPFLVSWGKYICPRSYKIKCISLAMHKLFVLTSDLHDSILAFCCFIADADDS